MSVELDKIGFPLSLSLALDRFRPGDKPTASWLVYKVDVLSTSGPALG